MRYIIFSFDDGRLDTYVNAIPIMKKYNIRGTLNIVSDFILNEKKYQCFGSSDNRSMSVSNILECQKEGIEIALHGATHQNTVEDIRQNIEDFQKMGVEVREVGFASPFSELTEENFDQIYRLVQDGEILYIRSGTQIRRKGIWFIFLSALNRIFPSRTLFYYLNKDNIISCSGNPSKFLKGVSITKDTTVKEISYFVNKLQDMQAAILIFHSILKKSDKGYNKDNWFWNIDRFEKLCRTFNGMENIQIITTKQLYKKSLKE